MMNIIKALGGFLLFPLRNIYIILVLIAVMFLGYVFLKYYKLLHYVQKLKDENAYYAGKIKDLDLQLHICQLKVKNAENFAFKLDNICRQKEAIYNNRIENLQSKLQACTAEKVKIVNEFNEYKEDKNKHLKDLKVPNNSKIILKEVDINWIKENICATLGGNSNGQK